MMSRILKQSFYFMCSPLMKFNSKIYRALIAPKSTKEFKVHLGPDQNKYINNWVNIDANIFTGKSDIWADLRNPLPLHNETVDCFYSHHVIEHLPDIDKHVTDIYRCLKPGGVYRVAGPNGDAAILKFANNDTTWFEAHAGFPTQRSSIGGSLNNFLFCKGEHLHILTQSFLEEILISHGFTEIQVCKPAKETKYPHLFQECLATEHEIDFVAPHTLVIEAQKPNSQ